MTDNHKAQEQIQGISGTTQVQCTPLFFPQKSGQNPAHCTRENMALFSSHFRVCSASVLTSTGERSPDSATSLALKARRSARPREGLPAALPRTQGPQDPARPTSAPSCSTASPGEALPPLQTRFLWLQIEGRQRLPALKQNRSEGAPPCAPSPGGGSGVGDHRVASRGASLPARAGPGL